MCKINQLTEKKKSKLISLVIGMSLIGCTAWAEINDVFFTASTDGTKQAYIEILPKNFKSSKKYDVIIGLHGHGSDRNQFAKSSRGETEAFRNIASKYDMIAICPDYRAKTSWMGSKAESDLLDIIHALKKKYKVQRIFLIGGSMGGTSALTFAALHPELIAGVTSMNGHANHLEYENFQPAIAKSFGGSKKKIPQEYKKRSAEYWPEKLTMPIAFTVGGKDTSVPQDSVLRLAGVLKKINPSILIIERPNTGHKTSYDDAMKALNFMYESAKKSMASTSNNTSLPTGSESSSKPENAAVSTSQENGGVFFANSKPKATGKGAYDLGLKFSIQKAGEIKAFFFYQAGGETGAHQLYLWDSSGQLVTTLNAPSMPQTGWIRVALPKPLKVEPGNEYIISYSSNSYYPVTAGIFKAAIKQDGITAMAGLYKKGGKGARPRKTYKNMNYFLDIKYEKIQ